MDRIHVGTMGWSYNFWVGNFYGQGTRSNEYLTDYSKHFDTVEIDNTFYRILAKPHSRNGTSRRLLASYFLPNFHKS